MKTLSKLAIFVLLLFCLAAAAAGQNCPTIRAIGPTSDAKFGDVITISVNVIGGDPKAYPTYNWSVSAGSITSGQGTSVIKVDVQKADSVTATVEVGGFGSECARASSYTVSVARTVDLGLTAAEKFFNEGQELAKAFKHADAVKAFGECIKLAPEVMACWAMRGLSNKSLDRLDEAIVDLTKAIGIDSTPLFLYEERGDVHFAKKMFPEAVNDYSRLIKPGTMRTRDLLFRGLAYSGMKSWAGAIADYTTCISMEPKNAGCYANRGAANLAIGKRDDAIADFRKALEIDKDFWLAKSELEKLGIK